MPKLLLFLLTSLVLFLLPAHQAEAARCTVDKTTMKPEDSFNFTATELIPNQKYQLYMNGRVAETSTSTGYGEIRLDNIQPSKTLGSFIQGLSISLKQMPGTYACQNLTVSIDTSTSNPTPIRGNQCCSTSTATYKWEDNKCYDYSGAVPVENSSCKPGDYCSGNVCYTPSKRYYLCDQSAKICQETRDYIGQPNPQFGNPDKEACDQSCSQNGTSFNSPLNIAPTTPPCKDPSSPTFDKNLDKACTSAAGKTCIYKHPTDPQGDTFGVETAIGCVPTEPTVLVKAVLGFSARAGGGVALLLIIYGVFQMITSAGNPDAVKKGGEQITSAVIGLLFILFSALLLKVIGVDILQIPGFS